VLEHRKSAENIDRSYAPCCALQKEVAPAIRTCQW